ncbi:MAG: hypothetical protein ACREVN_04115 [Gammaproteobacteria bacterium]
MKDKIDDTGTDSSLSYRGRLLKALWRESGDKRKPKPADADHERLLLESDPYLAKLTRDDKR